MNMTVPNDVIAHHPRTSDSKRESRSESKYHLEVVDTLDGLLESRAIWDQLVEEAGIKHPFLSHAWTCTWWECFGTDKQLYVVVVKKEGKVVGIAPMMRTRRHMYGLPVQCISSLYNPHTPRCDFIVAANEADEIFRSIWRFLHSVAEQWDVLQLSQVLTDSPTGPSLSQLAGQDGYLVGTWHGEQSPYIPYKGKWEDYLKSLNGKHRSNLRNRFKRLSELGEVRLEVVSASEQVTAALDEGFSIEAAAWKSNSGTAIKCEPGIEIFYRTLAEHAARTGMLRLLFLTLDGVRIAFAYGLYHDNKLYVLKTGYDPGYARYSPYNLLCYLVFKDGFDSGMDEYEFLGNNEAWKLEWTKDVRRHDWLFILSPRWRTRFVYYAKFQWIPILQRHQVYRRLRYAIFRRPGGLKCWISSWSIKKR